MAGGADRIKDKKPLKKRVKEFVKNIFDALTYGLFLAFKRLLLTVSHNTARKFMRNMGYVWYWVDSHHRNMALHNLRIAFSAEKSPGEIREILLNHFLHLAETFADLVRSGEMTRENRDKYFIYENDGWILEEVHRVVGTKRAVIAISAHLGSQEMLVGHLLKWGCGREYIVAKKIDNPYLNRYVQGQRELLGVRVIPDRHHRKEIIKRLQDGDVLVFVVDQRAGYDDGIRVNFFGEPVCAHKGVAQMAAEFNAYLVPIFPIKSDEGRYRLIYGDNIQLQNTGDKAADTRANVQLIQSVIEKMVRQYPEQWFWVHNRWRDGEGAPLE